MGTLQYLLRITIPYLNLLVIAIIEQIFVVFRKLSKDFKNLNRIANGYFDKLAVNVKQRFCSACTVAICNNYRTS